MAYVPNQQIPKEEENKFALNSPTTPNPIPPQAGGSSGAGATGGKNVPGVASSTQFGSNAAKLSDYLNANKEQVGQFGQKVAGDLTNRYNQTMGNINQGYSDFSNQIGSSYTPYDPSKAQAAMDNPAEFVKDSKNVQDFQSWYNPQYKGPENFEGSDAYSNLNNQVNKAVQDAGLVGSQAGLGTYLNNYLNANDYTQGMKTLDTALLQRSPEAAQSIKTAAQPFSNLSSYFADTTNKANQDVVKTKQGMIDKGTELKNKFTGEGGIVPTLQNDLTNRLNQTRTSQGNLGQKAISDFMQGTNLTPEELSILGLSVPNNADLNEKATLNTILNAPQTAKILTSDYGAPVDLNSYFAMKGPEAVYNSPGMVANPDEIARMQALGQLTGQDFSGFLGSTDRPGNIIDTNKSGLAQLNTQLSDRDFNTVVDAFKNYSGSRVTDTNSFLDLANNHPDLFNSYLSTLMGDTTRPGYNTLKNALGRLGYSTQVQPPPVIPDPGDGTGGGYMFSSTSGGKIV